MAILAGVSQINGMDFITMATRITIITVCYNALKDLKKTADSVYRQTYQNVEYLIVDGNSTDGTRTYLDTQQLRFASSHIDFRYVSESDDGIYDAMNKGTKLATGDFLLFLNAGDYLADEDVLSSIFSDNDYSSASVVYGNHITSDGTNFQKIQVMDARGLRKTMIFSHQAAFIRRSEQLRYPYNPQYHICADYDFFLHLYLEGKSFVRVPVYVSVFQEGGLCQQSVNRTTKQVFDVRRAHGIINKRNYLFYWLKRWQYVIRKGVISRFRKNGRV